MATAAAPDRLSGRSATSVIDEDKTIHGLKVSVVIPTLNEAPNLPHVFERLPNALYELIVVDGLSSDDTVGVARSLRPDVQIVKEAEPGKGKALARGFSECNGDVIVMMDADGSNDPGEIDSFVRTLAEGADFAKGSRCLDGGGSADFTQGRRLGNRLLNSFVNILFRTAYTDLCYGYNAFRRSCLDSLAVDCSGFEVETMINIRVAKLGLRVAEVPSYEHARIHGQSKLHPVRDGWRVLRMILTERFRGSRTP